jgi:peptidoglycan hydrolase CwlO-like protein
LQFVAKLLRAEPLPGHWRRRFVKRTMAGTGVAVVCLSAALITSVHPAGADPIGATRAQISATRAQIESGAAQVHALTLAFQQANLQATTLGQQVQADQAQIDQLQGRVSATQRTLRRQALLSYTGGTSSSLGTQPATSDPSVGMEYLQVAAGNINDTVDQFRAQQRQLARAEAGLVDQQHQSEAAAADAARARTQALAAAAGEQARLDQLQTQLNQYVEAAAVAAQQQAAQAAAAARAAQAAQAQAAQTALAAPAPPVASASQGLPVNGGLVSVVHAVVTAPPPAPVAAPAPAPVANSGGAGGVWLQLRECESSNNYAENSGNGYYGAYQFSAATWSGLGYPGRPDLEPPSMQDQAAMRLQAQAGWGQWPACAAALGLT